MQILLELYNVSLIRREYSAEVSSGRLGNISCRFIDIFTLLDRRHRLGVALNGIEEGIEVFPTDHRLLDLLDLKIEFIDGDGRGHAEESSPALFIISMEAAL